MLLPSPLEVRVSFFLLLCRLFSPLTLPLSSLSPSSSPSSMQTPKRLIILALSRWACLCRCCQSAAATTSIASRRPWWATFGRYTSTAAPTTLRGLRLLLRCVPLLSCLVFLFFPRPVVACSSLTLTFLSSPFPSPLANADHKGRLSLSLCRSRGGRSLSRHRSQRLLRHGQGFGRSPAPPAILL